jgi:hypothetical protein
MADGWAHYGYAAAGQPSAAAVASLDPTTQPQVAVVEGKVTNGVLTARLNGPRAGAAWLIRRITVSTPGSVTTVRAYCYVGEPAPETLVMGTRSGQLDIAREDPPLYVPDGFPLVLQWDTGPSRALARVEYQEV